MSPVILLFFVAAGALRLGTLAVSIRNERHLKGRGAVEHGAGVTSLLAAFHVAFYPASFIEAWTRGTQADALTYGAMTLYVASMAVLFHVISQLGELWTVKLIVAQWPPVEPKPSLQMGPPSQLLPERHSGIDCRRLHCGGVGHSGGRVPRVSPAF